MSSEEPHRQADETGLLEQCANCGRHLAHLGNHACSTERATERTPTRTDRTRRAAADARDDEIRVGIYRRAGGNTYAYHELVDSEVLCGCSKYTKATTFEIVTRAEAKSRGRAPCGNCRRVQES